MEDLLKQTAKGSIIIFFGLVLGSFIRYVSYILFARLLGPSDYGLISLGLALLGVLATFSLIGLTKGVPRYIAFHKKKEITRGLIKTSLKYSLSISIFIAIMLILLSEQISIYFNTGFVEVLPYFALTLPFFVLTLLGISIFRGLKKFKYKVYIGELLRSTILVSTFLLLYSLCFGLYSAILAVVLSFSIPAIVSFILIHKEINLFGKTEYITKELLKFSLPLLLLSFFYLIIRWSDVIILGIFRTSDYVGIYNTALPTAMAMTVIVSAVAYVFLPIASELFAKKRMKELNSLYRTTTRWLFITSFPLFLIFFLFPSHIISFIFGAEYIAASLPLSILSIGVVTSISTGLIGSILVIMGKPKIIMWAGSFAALVNIVLNVTLIPIYGMIGAAISTTIAISIANLIKMYLVRKKVKLPYSLQYLKHIFAAIVPAFLIYLISKAFFEVIPLYIKIIGLAAYILLYALLTIILKGITKEDVIILKSIEKKTGFKITPLRNFIKRFV